MQRTTNRASARLRLGSFHEFIETAFHVQFGQFGEAADALAVDQDLRHRACAVGDARKFSEPAAIGVDADFLERDVPFLEQRLGILAVGTDAGAVDFDSCYRCLLLASGFS